MLAHANFVLMAQGQMYCSINHDDVGGLEFLNLVFTYIFYQA